MPPQLATPPDGERPAKKPRVSSEDFFNDRSKEINWLDIEDVLASAADGETEPGWIAGDVFMVFESKQKSEAQLKSGRLQLKVSIQFPNFQRFKFSFRQSLRISLRGAQVVKMKTGTSAPGYMPFSLVFKDGAAVKYVVGGKVVDDGTVVDSWQREVSNDNAHNEEDWFQSSPAAGRDAKPGFSAREGSATATNSSSHSSPFPETPGRNVETIPYESSITISNGGEQEEELAMDMDVRDLAQSVVAPHEKEPPRERESGDRSDPSALIHDKKKLKKRETRHDHLHAVRAESGSDSREAEPVKPPKLSTRERRRLKRKLQRESEQTSPEPPKRNPALDLVAGLSTESGAYPSLTELLKNSFVHVIGVVGSIEPPSMTRKGDFCLTLTLVDPSKFQNGSGFKVTCFMKAGFEHLLPLTAQKGHALLIRNVKTAEWNKNINGTVYPDRLKWIGYNPDTGKVYYPEVNSASGSPDGPFDALYVPNDSEVRYLVQLGEWWQAVKEEEERGAIQVGEYTRRRREHRLIGSCDVDEFFNATVEILRLEEAESGQTTVLFTDYTPHRLRSNDGYYGQWAVHASTGMLDSWLLDMMRPGTYWSIDNMRLKISHSGSFEAELYGAKMYELESDGDDVHLRELLKRKEAYLREHPQNPGEGDSAECLMSDISQPGHYNIIAEVLYRTAPRDAVMDLYVTDYTDYNQSLSSYKPEALKKQLNGSPMSVLQISCWDGHELIRDMEIGRIYSFCDVRIREQDGKLKGNLKFVDKRITRMNVKRTDNEAVLALLERKKDYEASVSAAQGSDNPLPKEQKLPIATSSAIKTRYTSLPVNTIAQIKSSGQRPNKFRLVARIVDFFPLDICDFTVRWCTSCNARIPDNYNACVKCEDFMEEYVKWLFNFWFMLEDETGEKLAVDVGAESKYFLQGLEPCDLKDNHDALWAIKRRLQGCLGNLVEVHEGLKREEVIEAQCAPYFDLAIRTWEVTEGVSARTFYALTGCEAVEQSRRLEPPEC